MCSCVPRRVLSTNSNSQCIKSSKTILYSILLCIYMIQQKDLWNLWPFKFQVILLNKKKSQQLAASSFTWSDCVHHQSEGNFVTLLLDFYILTDIRTACGMTTLHTRTQHTDKFAYHDTFIARYRLLIDNPKLKRTWPPVRKIHVQLGLWFTGHWWHVKRSSKNDGYIHWI